MPESSNPLRPHYLTCLQENTQSEQHQLEAFIDRYLAGDSTLSALQKAANISKPTAIKWRNLLRDVDSKYSYLLDYTSLSSEEAGHASAKVLIDPTSREFVLEALGWGLVKARENGNPDQIARLAKQMADIQGYKAKEMGRDYDITQRLGDEGIQAVDKEAAMCILALSEHPQHYPQTMLAIKQASVRILEADEQLAALGISKPPSSANAGLDTLSPTPMTDQLAIAHAAPGRHSKPSYSSSPDDDDENGMTDTVDELLNIDDVLEDLT